ncbi:hypothetical protein SDC9_200028 [bioreactor metagenome]|uniref:Uncharacterized protein n=1 Tax=bioreactor metagenome TaxID=1076179 RepID=A0A645IM85_9ZZZZ
MDERLKMPSLEFGPLIQSNQGMGNPRGHSDRTVLVAENDCIWAGTQNGTVKLLTSGQPSGKSGKGFLLPG